jgi:hypothetical protein
MSLSSSSSSSSLLLFLLLQKVKCCVFFGLELYIIKWDWEFTHILYFALYEVSGLQHESYTLLLAASLGWEATWAPE